MEMSMIDKEEEKGIMGESREMGVSSLGIGQSEPTVLKGASPSSPLLPTSAQESPNRLIRPVQIRLTNNNNNTNSSLQSVHFYPQPVQSNSGLSGSVQSISQSLVSSQTLPPNFNLQSPLMQQVPMPQLTRPVHTVLASYPVGGPPTSNPNHHFPLTDVPMAMPKPSAAGRNRPQAKRKQVKNACVNCQRACKKCDDMRPCSRCVKYGMAATCVDSARKERRRGVSITSGSPSETSGRRTPQPRSMTPSVGAAKAGIVTDEEEEDYDGEEEEEDNWSQSATSDPNSLKIRLQKRPAASGQQRTRPRSNTDPALFKELVSLCADEWEELEHQDHAPPPSVLIQTTNSTKVDAHFEPVQFPEENAAERSQHNATPAVATHELIPTPPETPNTLKEKEMKEEVKEVTNDPAKEAVKETKEVVKEAVKESKDVVKEAVKDTREIVLVKETKEIAKEVRDAKEMHSAPLPYTTKAQPGWSKHLPSGPAAALAATLPFLSSNASSAASSAAAVTSSLNFVDLSKAFQGHNASTLQTPVVAQPFTPSPPPNHTLNNNGNSGSTNNQQQ